jgi:hypothetical protein
MLDRSRNGECDIRAETDDERFCRYVAAELMGNNAKYCEDWDMLQCLRLFKPFSVEHGLVTYFSWPAQDRLEPPPTPYEVKVEALRSATHIYDKHGVELHRGDVVTWPAKGVLGFFEGYAISNDAQGRPQVGRYTSVRTYAGKFVAIEVTAIASELEFMARRKEASED